MLSGVTRLPPFLLHIRRPLFVVKMRQSGHPGAQRRLSFEERKIDKRKEDIFGSYSSKKDEVCSMQVSRHRGIAFCNSVSEN